MRRLQGTAGTVGRQTASLPGMWGGVGTLEKLILGTLLFVIPLANSVASVLPGVGDASAALDMSVPPAGSPSFGRCELVWVGEAPAWLQSQAARIVERSFRGPCDAPSLGRGIRSLVQLLTDAGHYRAEVRPGDFRLDDQALRFTLTIEPGPVIEITGWRLFGSARTDTVWLARALGLPTGVAATREVLATAERQLRRFCYLQSLGPPEVECAAGDTAAIVILRLRERPTATFNGALAAAGEGVASEGPAFAGSLSLGLHGLFRRDRSLALRYERLRREETMFHLEAAETASLRGRLDWRWELEEWDRGDHRQHIRIRTACRLDRRRDRRAEFGLQWSKITPGRTTIHPARVLGASLGVAEGSLLAVAAPVDRSMSAWSLSVTYSSRRDVASGTAGLVFRRTMLELRIVRDQSLRKGMSVRLSGRGRWWSPAPGDLGPGDEWFLGGVEGLRGYHEHAITAASGVTGTIELCGRTTRAVGASAFIDGAYLTPFGVPARPQMSPCSYGVALHLFASDRTGRLEFAWRDRVAWRDGIVRLTVSQGW